LKFEIEIADELVDAYTNTWQKCAGFKLVVDGDQLDIHIASTSAALEAAIRSERTPKVATQPGEFGNIRWR
jgi:hypothetical protein